LAFFNKDMLFQEIPGQLYPRMYLEIKHFVTSTGKMDLAKEQKGCDTLISNPADKKTWQIRRGCN